MSEIRRIRRQSIRLKKLFKDKADGFSPEGHVRLPFKRSLHEEYTFEDSRVLINGMDILSMIEGEKVDVELLDKLVCGVDAYRRYVWSKFGTDKKDFNAQTQGILEKGMNKLGLAYSEMSGGIRARLNGGRLWINDIDPKVVLVLFLSNPTNERRRYLKSIQMKLALILEGRAGNGHSRGILDSAKQLFTQIHKAMENTPSANPPPLLAAASNMAG